MIAEDNFSAGMTVKHLDTVFFYIYFVLFYFLSAVGLSFLVLNSS